MQFGETPTHKGAARGGAVASAPCAGAGLPCCMATTKAGLQLKPGELCGMYHHHPRRRHCFEIALPPPPPSCVQTCVSNPPGLLIYFPITCPTRIIPIKPLRTVYRKNRNVFQLEYCKYFILRNNENIHQKIICLLVQCVTRLDVGLLVEVVVGGGRVGLTIKDKLN